MYNVIGKKNIADREKGIEIVLHKKSINDYHIRKELNNYHIIVKCSTKHQVKAALEVLVKQGYHIVNSKYLYIENPVKHTQYNLKNDKRFIVSIVVAPPQPTGPLPPLPDPGGNIPNFRRKRRGKKK